MFLGLSLYGLIAFSYIGFKILMSTQYSPTESDATPSVSVVIPEYNEDADLFRRGLESILAQDYPNLAEVWVVDDGSDDTAAWDVAQEFAAEHDLINAHRLDENQGKRHAQAYAFERATGDVFVTVDSDTILEVDAIANIVKPFADDEVQAVTGYPKIINRETNLLTRCIDMRYWVAFNVERAAKSVFGQVVCCCGVLSAYRRDMVTDSLEEYTTQTFLGRECTFGDDRHLTAHALQRGTVKYQSTAQAYTDAPEAIGEYITQQVRWMRSFWRESLLALRWAPRRGKFLTTVLVVDLALPFALLAFGYGAVIRHALFVNAFILVTYAGVIGAVAYLRNAPYIRQELPTYLASPLYAVFYIGILLPLSFYALVTMRTNGWGTR